MIRLDGVCRTYEVGGQPVYALVDVTETVDAGNYIAIIGPSGSGKSTLLNIIGCLDRPTSGSYWLDDHLVSELTEGELSEVRRHKIGFVFQFFHLIPRLTAAGNVELPMMFAGVPRPERRRRVAAALTAVGLAPRMHHRPNQLSGGERQRVAIARATIMQPRILLVDEPTGNLDTASGEQVMALLERMNAAGLTLLVVTHNPELARRAQRVLVLRDGRIVHRVAGRDLRAEHLLAPLPA